MPETLTLTTSALIDGDTFTDVLSVAANSTMEAGPSVPAAKVGQLTTRTDDNTGVLTMVAGHGFVSTNVIDVFWSGGSRRGMVATVAVNAVTVDGGSGDVLPANLTAITSMIPVQVPHIVTGSGVVAIGVSSPVPGWIVYVDAAAADIVEATYRVTATGGYGKQWLSGNGITNPLTGDVTSVIKFSHGEISAVVMKAKTGFN